MRQGMATSLSQAWGGRGLTGGRPGVMATRTTQLRAQRGQRTGELRSCTGRSQPQLQRIRPNAVVSVTVVCGEYEIMRGSFPR
jgi:hypothetical protein